MTNQDKALAIKELLVDMAVNDKLPMDMTMLDESIFLPILGEKDYLENARQLLSADTDEELTHMIELIANHDKKDDLIELVSDDVVVCQSLEFRLTCKEFLEQIGYE